MGIDGIGGATLKVTGKGTLNLGGALSTVTVQVPTKKRFFALVGLIAINGGIVKDAAGHVLLS